MDLHHGGRHCAAPGEGKQPNSMDSCSTSHEEHVDVSWSNVFRDFTYQPIDLNQPYSSSRHLLRSLAATSQKLDLSYRYKIIIIIQKAKSIRISRYLACS